MKRILIYLFLLFSISAGAQTTTTTQWQGAPLTKIINRGVLQVDSALLSPVRDTTFTPVRVGVQVFREADLSLYVSIALTGKKWEKIGAAGSGGAWGTITGTLASQTDLQSALGAKQDTITTGSSTQYFKGNLSLGTFSTDVRSVGDAVYSQLGHTHTSAQVTDFTEEVRSLFSAGTGLSYNSTTGQFSFSGGGSGTYLFSAPLNESGGTVSITQANGSTNGYLSAVDWTLFNGKVSQDALDDTAAALRALIAAATPDSFTYATRRYVDSSTTVFGSRLYDTYNAHDTLTQSRGVWMQTYGVTFYSEDGTETNATGINNSGFTSKRSKHDFTANNGWIYGQLHDPAQVYKSRFQVIGLVNDSTHSAQLISTNNNNYNKKAALVSAAWWEGVKLQANVNWTTSGSTSGYKGIYVYSTAGDGTGQVKIDREVLSTGASTDSAIVRKPDGTLGLYPVSGGGGASSYKAFQTATDGATVTFDMSLTDNWQVTIGGNRNFSFTNASNGQFLTLKLTQDATGSREPVWPANFKWIGATAPDFTDTGGTTDIVTAVYDGTNWWANYGKNYN